MTLDIYLLIKTSLSTAKTKVYQNCNNVNVGIFARVYYTIVVGGVVGYVRVLLS